MIINGHCPTLKKDHSIDVEYINASNLEENKYIKGLFTCSVVSFGGDCRFSKDCPLYRSAPNEK